MRIGLVVPCLMLPVAALAQQPADAVPAGSRVRVQLHNATAESLGWSRSSRAGELLAATPDSVQVRFGAEETRWLARTDVRGWWVSRGTRMTYSGMVFGTLAGAAIGAAIGNGLGKCEPNTFCLDDVDKMGDGILIGGAAGLLVGALVTRNTRVDKWHPVARDARLGLRTSPTTIGVALAF